MAAVAVRDQEKRKVEVNRLKLVGTLKANLQKHVAEYNEAMAGYKAELLDKINKAFDKAEQQLAVDRKKMADKVAAFTDEDIRKQDDYITLVNPIGVEMKVPRSYAKEYEAAIDMAEWDVRETLELTHAEFTCFVRDEWDWKSEFEAITSIYNKR